MQNGAKSAPGRGKVYRLRVILRGEVPDIVPAFGLDLVHRDIGMLHQRGHVGTIVREDRNPDARGCLTCTTA